MGVVRSNAAFQRPGDHGGSGVRGRSQLTASSPPLAAIDQRENLPLPIVNQPVVACDTAVLASNLIPAGELELSSDRGTQQWTNIAAAYWATGIIPLKQGTLKASQRLPGCGGQSGVVDVPVGPAVVPPAPLMQPFCPDAKRIVVSGLKASGVLTIWSKPYDDTAETEIGSLGIGSSVEQVDLPQAIGGQGNIMVIVARQSLCGLTSPPGQSLEFARPGSGALPPPTPKIVAPLLACMKAIPAEGLFNGVLTQGYSARTGSALTDPTIVTSPMTRLPTWFPLVADDHVEVRQVGCSAPSKSAAERVHPLPSPLPPPKICEPVRPGDQIVVVEKCLPGSRVHLLIEWTERAATDQTWTGEAVFHLPVPLKERQRLWAVQTMCLLSSTREGTPVVVSKGNLNVSVTPSSAPGGKSISFMVETRDQQTGALVSGLPVTIGGTPVGATGAAFGFTPPTAGSSVSGVVAGGVAYNNASFSIAIQQAVPVVLNLFPGPTAEPNKVWQTDVVWTLTPRWAGAAPITLNGNLGTAMVPPPPGAEKRVGISLSLKAHLQGEIGGIVWPYQTIDLAGQMAELAVTANQHAVSCRFWFQATDVPIVDDDGQVTGWETKLAAGVQLFSIS